MYGLAKDTNLTFLLGKRVERVEVSEYQAQIHFTGSISFSIEGESELDKEPITYAELSRLIGNTISSVTVQDDGTLDLAFVDQTQLSVLDSEPYYESYQITAPGMTIVV